MNWKKKKQLEIQLQSIQGKKLNLDTQIMALEDAHLNKETLESMRIGTAALKTAMKDTDVDKTEDIMEEITEEMDKIAEINGAMSQPLGPVMDEDELEAELAELEELEADELLSDMPTTTQKYTGVKKETELDIPDIEVPSHKIKPKSTEDDELAELEAMVG